jgi:uncharacterized metal-binding protein
MIMAAKNSMPARVQCKTKKCQQRKDCFAKANNHRQLYKNTTADLHRADSEIEAKYYRQKTRLDETILFAK